MIPVYIFTLATIVTLLSWPGWFLLSWFFKGLKKWTVHYLCIVWLMMAAIVANELSRFPVQ